ncbi:MAG: hypothetical protein AAF571_07665 [Verrucomicrobiota bacterium]
MPTTRPPLSRKGLFYTGIGIGLLACVIFMAVVLLAGGFVSRPTYETTASQLADSQLEVERLDKNNKELLEENESLKGKVTASQELVDSLNQSVNEVKAEVTQYRQKENQVQFVIDRREMEIKSLAKQLYEIEGLDVRVMNNGVLVTGIVPPFRMGSNRIEDDTLIPRLEAIAEVFNRVNTKEGLQYYAAAVGNTDATPVKAWSAHHSNMWLGAKRARSLADKMKSAGFPQDETLLISWGSIQSNQKDFDPESRKAEIFIMPADSLGELEDLKATDASATNLISEPAAE